MDTYTENPTDLNLLRLCIAIGRSSRLKIILRHGLYLSDEDLIILRNECQKAYVRNIDDIIENVKNSGICYLSKNEKFLEIWDYYTNR